ncbi:YciI family protein [Actinotalea ferrariae]|uniref:YciI family protein n=1 Tax=Actinotalea ferrariae TaxID=1386098 RepID=UPI001C8BA512|nr:YciI family protein [Actinotalea ferrariae]MBX9243306.1 YciI family protein [Actinotalea ferrariae]
MRVLVMIKGSGADEDKIAPTEEMFAQMGAYNEELVKAGIMLGGDGLRPSKDGAKVVFDGGDVSVVDGPFTEAKEIVGGYWIWEVSSLEEAVEWAKKCPSDPSFGVRQVLEIRPYFETEDFGEAFTPELRAKEEELAAQIKAQHPDA